MLTPVPSVLPDSTLAPADILAKFSSQSLAGLGGGFLGLGCGCSDYDELGDCLDPDPCAVDTSGGSSSGPLFPITTPVTTPVVSPGSGGGGNTTVISAPGSTVDYSKLLTALAQGGINIAELSQIQPGTTLNQSGITRQTPGATTQGTPLTTSTSLTAGGSSGMIMIAVLALGAFAVFGMRQNK